MSGKDFPQDPPPQYEAGGYAAPSSAQSGYGYDQPAAGYGYNQPAAGYNQPAAGYNQPAAGYGKPAESYGYDQPNDGYTRPPLTQQPAQQQQTTVVMNSSSPTVVIQHPAQRPPDYLWLSCLVYWCCCALVGCIAMGFSMASTSSADDGRMEEARSHGKAALTTSVVGIVLGIICLIVFIILYSQGKFTYDTYDHDPYHSHYG